VRERGKEGKRKRKIISERIENNRGAFPYRRF
jgi:hypothetical protein